MSRALVTARWSSPGWSRPRWGPGRDMGPGWIEVAADAVADEAQLASWVDLALAHNRKRDRLTP
ncbi:hypothetical protein [Tessaracoccus terricola]